MSSLSHTLLTRVTHLHNITCVNHKSHHTRFVHRAYLTRVGLNRIAHVSIVRHSIHVYAQVTPSTCQPFVKALTY